MLETNVILSQYIFNEPFQTLCVVLHSYRMTILNLVKLFLVVDDNSKINLVCLLGSEVPTHFNNSFYKPLTFCKTYNKDFNQNKLIRWKHTLLLNKLL